MLKENETPYANSVFEQPWWLDIVAPGQWSEVFVKEDGMIIARLPFVLKNGGICMSAFTQTLGPWISPKYRTYQQGNAQLAKQKEIINGLLGQLPKHKFFRMCFDSSNDYVLPYRWHGFHFEPSFSYRIKNLNPIETVIANYSNSVMKNIKRAQKKVTIINDPNPEWLLNSMEKTFANQKRKYPGSGDAIRRIVKGAIEHNAGKMFCAMDSLGHVHACSFLVYDANCAYALLGGSDPDYRASGAKSLVWDEEIKYASSVSKMFDFEGSSIEGIENFVRQFGGERVINYFVIKQSYWRDCLDSFKPRVKKLIRYKI